MPVSNQLSVISESVISYQWNRCHMYHNSIDFVMCAEVDKQQHFSAGLGMFLFRENDTEIVVDGTGVESGQLAAEMVGLQARIVHIRCQAAQCRLDLRLQRRVSPDQTTKCAFKPGRQDEFAHGLLVAALQAGT